MSNVFTFPRRSTSPETALRNPSFLPENVVQLEVQKRGRRRSGRSLHTFVFRSYEAIVASDEADLMRDVSFDTRKARVKLRKIREQLELDREHAAAREKLLSSAESRLSAAIDAAQSLAVPLPGANQPRRTNSDAMARNRAFKETMRQRIRDIAASRGLSDEEIKGVLTCKHHEIAKFTETHGVNPEWLLAGKGRIFEKDSIVPNPNMTGAEFVAALSTLPTTAQRVIMTMVDEMLEKRRP
ncbi:hypothetical protein JIR23_21150 [Bradyrhizobium diazoefficiens]|nr:hypothetical protein [Bradyrhizobium diazoefficiens]QQN62109.1 hypothetical protein JIR23_21150 [Bradyrhizobium diazoefficiens]